MLDEKPMETHPPADWCAGEPRLRMAAEKGQEPKVVIVRKVELRQVERRPEPRAPMSPQVKRAALIAACALLAPVLVYFLAEWLLVARVKLPAAQGSAQVEELHSLRRYLWTTPQRGDRVVTSDHSKLLVQRIIARPSDSLKLKDGLVYINGKKLDKRVTPVSHEKLIQLGENQYYAVDDNGGTPSHGVVYRKNIVGRLTE